MTNATRRMLERAGERAAALGLPHLEALTSFTMVEENMRGAWSSSSFSSTSSSVPGLRQSGAPDPGLFAGGSLGASVGVDVSLEFLNGGRSRLDGGRVGGSTKSIGDGRAGGGRGGGRGGGGSAYVDHTSMMAIDDTFSNAVGGSGGSASSSGEGTTRGRYGTTSHEVHSLLSKQPSVSDDAASRARSLYLRASGWELFGHIELSITTLRKMLRTYGNIGWTIDILAGMCKLAHLEYKSSIYRVTEKVESSSVSVSSIPESWSRRTSEQLVVNSLRTLIIARQRLVSIVRGGIDPIRLWSFATCSLIFSAALRRCLYPLAKRILDRMTSLRGCDLSSYGAGSTSRNESMSDAAHVAHIDVQLCNLQYLSAVGRFQEVYDLANDVYAPSCRKRGLEVRFSYQKVYIVFVVLLRIRVYVYF